MTSAPQLEANRANAAHSTGPATAAGKAAVRYNATRHGLTSQVACMSWEDREAFNQFCAGLVGEYQPAGALETQLAQAIAEDHWRLNRVRAIEQNIFALGGAAAGPNAETDNPQIDIALAQAQTFCDQGKTFALVTLYEQRINRNLAKNTERLTQLQASRRAARDRALEDLLDQREFDRLHPAPTQGEDEALSQTEASGSVPANGFVFSSREIDYAVFRRRRANLLAAASQLAA